MPLTSDQIANHVALLADAIMKDKKIGPEDKVVINAGVALVTNVLINFNEIAATARGRQP